MSKKTSKPSGNAEEAYREFKDIEADYVFDPSVMNEDESRVRAVKWIIDNKLNRVDKTLILLYADCLSFRKLGKRMGFSHTTMREEIKRIKVQGRTAIPRGVYEVRMTYSPRFGRDLPLLVNVPGFSGVRIHSGNTASDTEGCLLPGVNDVVGRVSNSRYWAGLLQKKIERATKYGEMVWIEVG